jgi:hypothetical protein
LATLCINCEDNQRLFLQLVAVQIVFCQDSTACTLILQLLLSSAVSRQPFREIERCFQLFKVGHLSPELIVKVERLQLGKDVERRCSVNGCSPTTARWQSISSFGLAKVLKALPSPLVTPPRQ